MALTWIGSEIVTKWRELTGRSSTSEISDAAVLNIINDYFQNYFVDEANLQNIRGTFTQQTTASDSGEYTIAQTKITL